MQIWAESGKSALPICNYSQILYQFLTFTQNLKRSPFRLVLYITVKGLHVKNTGRFLPVFFIRQILIPGAVLHT